MITLGPNDQAAGRAFAAPSRSMVDVSVMDRMLGRLREHLRGIAGRGRSRFDALTDDDGSVHKIVLPDLAAARTPGDLFAVGFFGQAREHVDHAPIVELEGQLIADMPSMAGLVAYYNSFHRDAGWGNLVLFVDEAAKSAWGGDARHGDAVARSPHHYHSIRLHNAIARGGLTGAGGIELVRTRYLDFRKARAWRAVRTYEAP